MDYDIRRIHDHDVINEDILARNDTFYDTFYNDINNISNDSIKLFYGGSSRLIEGGNYVKNKNIMILMILLFIFEIIIYL